ncbi:MAG: hypothetical protein ABEK59_01270 [Halobacteria archaeon]
MEVMVRTALMEEVVDEVGESVFHDEIHADELTGCTAAGNEIEIEEGKTSKRITKRAVNFITVALCQPAHTIIAVKERNREFLEELERDDATATLRLSDFDQYSETNTIRPMDTLHWWANVACRIEKTDVSEDHHRRYYAQLYRSLVSANHKTLWIGVLPWAEGKGSDGIVIASKPRRIKTVTEDDEVETNSADW